MLVHTAMVKVNAFPLHQLMVACTLVLPVSAQTAEVLRPRELFYRPIVPARPDPVAKAVERPAEPRAKPKKGGAKPRTKEDAGTHVSNNPPMVKAAVTTGEYPLALKYTVEMRASDGTYAPVSGDRAFRSGDRIRLKVEANDAGYLYVVQQGSSHSWSVLVPDPNIDGGHNHLAARVEKTVPRGGSFHFDEAPGDNKIFLVFTRRPQTDIGAVLTAVKTGSSGGVQMAKAQSPELPDSLVEQLQMRSRDLVFEKDPGEEKAVYVATPNRSAEAQIMTVVTLKHE